MFEQLWFIKPVGRGNDEEGNANVRKIWEVLEGDKNEGISVQALLLFTGAILNIQVVIDDPSQIVPEAQPREAGAEEEKAIQPPQQQLSLPPLTTEQILKVHKEFTSLFLNRKSNKPQKQQIKRNEIEMQHSRSKMEESSKLSESARVKPERQPGKPEEGKKYTLAQKADLMTKKKREHEEYLILYTNF